MKSRQQLELVNYLKGYSIFTVILFHLLQLCDLSGIMNQAISFGGAGIYAFILCSGFGLYLSQTRKSLPFKAFFKRRFVKIYVPFAIIILISALFPFMYQEEGSKFLQVMSNLFLFKMFMENFSDSLGPHLWFVFMIVQFYLTFPLIVKAYEKLKKPHLRIIVSFAISLAWTGFVYAIGKQEFRVWDSFFLKYVWLFVVGMQFGELYSKNISILKVPKTYVLFITAFLGLSLLAFSTVIGGVFKAYNDFASALGYISISLLVYRLGVKKINKVFIYISSFSYEWYLVHILVILFFFTFHQSILSVVIGFIVSSIIGMYFNKFLSRFVYSRIN